MELEKRLQPQYYKPSSALLEMQRKMRALVAVKRYADAEHCKVEAANLARSFFLH